MNYEFEKFQFQNAFVTFKTKGIQFKSSRTLQVLDIDYDLLDGAPVLGTINGTFFLRFDHETIPRYYSVTEDKVSFSMDPDFEMDLFLTIHFSSKANSASNTQT